MRLTNLVSLSSKLHNLLLEMPKEQRKILKAIRAKKMTTTKYPAGTVSLQVLGNSMYLFTDQTRYLFNCGEGTQRLAHEHKMKLAKLEHVFLTNNYWRCFGGLPGVSLTLQDIGVGTVCVHGPPGVDRLFLATRRFIILNSLEIRAVNACRGFDYEDHILRINYVPLYDDKNEILDKSGPYGDQTDYYSSTRKKMIDVVSDDNDKDEDENSLRKNVTICYICHIKKKEGTLLIDKCIEKGVPPGPLLGKLKSGEDIVLPNGQVVKASDVRTSDYDGPVFLVIDCPSLSHLESLINNEKIKKYQKEIFTHTVVHFTPLHIMENEKYQNWMTEFNISSKQVIINEELSGDGSEAVHKMQIKLNYIDEEVFPSLMVRENGRLEDFKAPAMVGRTLFKVNLRPKVDIDQESIPIIQPNAYIEELISQSEFMDEVSRFKSRSVDYPKKSKSSLVFLGTGSSIPNKTRNVSSILVNIDDENCMLMDCGEGTLQQLKRHSDYEKTLKNLKAIYISHLHADHHLGLINFLRLKKNLIVFAPLQIGSWLDLYSKNFEPMEYELVGLRGINFNVNSLGLNSIATCFVRHCPNSFGVSIVTKEGYKLTYSGDTMPCPALVEMGKNSDILIHEATMEDGLEIDAEKKMHSTVSQAIQTGKDMNAKFTILTHFSQRYAKVPMIEELDENVGIAFDNMSVNLGSVRRISGMLASISKGFADDFEVVRGRTAKRQMKKELIMTMST